MPFTCVALEGNLAHCPDCLAGEGHVHVSCVLCQLSHCTQSSQAGHMEILALRRHFTTARWSNPNSRSGTQCKRRRSREIAAHEAECSEDAS